MGHPKTIKRGLRFHFDNYVHVSLLGFTNSMTIKTLDLNYYNERFSCPPSLAYCLEIKIKIL